MIQMIENMWEEMRNMHCEMNRLFGDLRGWPEARLLGSPAGSSGAKEIQRWSPAAADINETDTNIIATFDMPGINKKDIELHVDEDKISVKAERKAEVKEEKKCFYHHERSYAGFYRQFPLPAKVLPEKADAEYKDGVLTVTLPKEEPRTLEKGKRLGIK